MKTSSRASKWFIVVVMVSAGWGLAIGGARAASSVATWEPDDPGNTSVAGGWGQLQWNFADASNGVDAPQAWENLIRAHRPGASGVTIAVLDTGVAYRNWGAFRRSPDFTGTRFVDPCDLVAGTLKDGRCSDPYPLDRDGHGTWVAGEIAEATNNHLGVTGLAYGATIMPVRVLNAAGWSYPSTVAEGIRYAVDHGAQVINLSLSFYLGMTASQMPTLISAISYAHAHGVVVVAAAGNDGADQLAYPARDHDVISVGASTQDGCLASYSDDGPQLDLVAPGGGDDAALKEAVCDSNANLPNLYQMTFANRGTPTKFSLPGNWYGTSMAAPEVSGAAAMVIASGVLGPHPSPDAILRRLEQTARQPVPSARGGRNDVYGYGIIDIGAATTPLTPPARAALARPRVTPAPLLSGSFAVTEMPVNYRAARSRPTWTFTPSCPFAACGVQLESSQGLTLAMAPDPDGLYHGFVRAGAAETATSCTVPHLHLFTIHDAYTLREDVYVRVSRSANGLATAISGSLIAAYTPTAGARRQGCQFHERAIERFTGHR